MDSFSVCTIAISIQEISIASVSSSNFSRLLHSRPAFFPKDPSKNRPAHESCVRHQDYICYGSRSLFRDYLVPHGVLWRIIIYHEQNIGLFYRNHRHYDHILSK
jgi:hypothetical protein